jgi:hypothetical protein
MIQLLMNFEGDNAKGTHCADWTEAIGVLAGWLAEETLLSEETCEPGLDHITSITMRSFTDVPAEIDAWVERMEALEPTLAGEVRDASGQPVICGCCLLPMAYDPSPHPPLICACTIACADADSCLVPGGKIAPAVFAAIKAMGTIR